MPGGPARETLRDLGFLFRFGVTGDLSDGQLLDRFIGHRDRGAEEAFAILVHRHGPMVLGVCRRVLCSVDDAEDAFQSTFLVLARKAAFIAHPETLANWLYGVALRTARDALARTRRRRAWEEQACSLRLVAAPSSDFAVELRTILDEELSRLPARFRGPLLLCELEAVSRHDAARRLGIPEGTLSSRLARAKSLLRERLTRRGLALTVSLITAVLASEARSATVPHSLAEFTARAAVLLAAGHSLYGLVATPVYSLTTEVLRTMLFTKIKGIAIGVLLVGSAVTGAMVLAQVPKGAEDPFATATVTAVGKAAPEPYATKAAEEYQTKQADGANVGSTSDSDRLHAVEQKLDRILEALGGPRAAVNSSGSSGAIVAGTTPAAVATTTASTPAGAFTGANRDNSVTETRTIGSYRDANSAVPDRLAAIERRMADLERRMSDLEQRLNRQRPPLRSGSLPAGPSGGGSLPDLPQPKM
jgi:RNA polymerase sigma factor (sigma-70 family)